MESRKSDTTRITNFISESKIATICCTDLEGVPYCFNCFYVFDEKNQLLFFKSSVETFHSKLLFQNAVVAGTILPQKLEFLALKGIQFTGIVLYNDIPDQIRPEVYYHKRLPLGLTKPGHVFCIQLEMIKMTDNTNIFGKKLVWNKKELVI